MQQDTQTTALSDSEHGDSLSNRASDQEDKSENEEHMESDDEELERLTKNPRLLHSTLEAEVVSFFCLWSAYC